jgi:hypothetical protein
VFPTLNQPPPSFLNGQAEIIGLGTATAYQITKAVLKIARVILRTGQRRDFPLGQLGREPLQTRVVKILDRKLFQA